MHIPRVLRVLLVSCIWHCCIYANAYSQVSAVCHLEGVLSDSRSHWQKNPCVAEAEPSLGSSRAATCPAKPLPNSYKLSLQGQNVSLYDKLSLLLGILPRM